MTERPIIFSGDMVRAILEGRKTQTRRVIKPQPRYTPNDCWTFYGKGTKVNFTPTVSEYAKEQMEEILTFCPYGIAGDRLWVQESYIYNANYDGLYANKENIVYRATTEPEEAKLLKWRSPLFMPHWASRILLDIKNVRVERVQDISERDAKAEGVEYLFTQEECDTAAGIKGTKQKEHGYKNYLWHGNHEAPKSLIDKWEYQYSGYDSARDSFSSLWHLLNAKRGYGWDKNPWIWVMEFERSVKDG